MSGGKVRIFLFAVWYTLVLLFTHTMSMYHLYFEKERMKRNSINQNIEVECFTIPSVSFLIFFFFPVLYLMSLEHLILFSFFFSFLVSCKGLFEKAFKKWNGCYTRNFSPRIKSPKSLGSSTDQFTHPFIKSYDNRPLRMYKLLTKVLGCEVSDVALSNPRIWENMAWVYCIESTVYWGCTIL